MAIDLGQHPLRRTPYGAAMTRLQRGIAITLGAKLVLLALLYALFFSPADRPPMTPGAG